MTSEKSTSPAKRSRGIHSPYTLPRSLLVDLQERKEHVLLGQLQRSVLQVGISSCSSQLIGVFKKWSSLFNLFYESILIYASPFFLYTIISFWVHKGRRIAIWVSKELNMFYKCLVIACIDTCVCCPLVFPHMTTRTLTSSLQQSPLLFLQLWRSFHDIAAFLSPLVLKLLNYF